MGLDMYAMTMENAPETAVDFEASGSVEFFYWRKHPNLHGWMETLYREKDGKAETFNCVNVALSSDDLDRLEADIKSGSLPHTSGFFFGASDGSEVQDDLDFVAKAKEVIKDGDTVFYTSWW
ncbi:phosphoglycerate kinase [Sneathiella aquimaris]|uniref:phosphoglycerate kinase n=1 Tax=Sneathiella aquimaris TaxID=2599305 RepID=UPI001469B880|nr:phosphoglycerate kinase [Sneathiella aquimaris]